MRKLGTLHTVSLVTLFCAVTAITSPSQSFTTLHSFTGLDGINPMAELVQATDGNFYGTAANGGAYNGGTVFKITSGGAFKVLLAFCYQPGACSGGKTPRAGLVQATDGNFYGTTSDGTYGGNSPDGTVFKMTPSGAVTWLHSFSGIEGEGIEPIAGLVQARGNFYGTTWAGGAHIDGTVFKITPDGTLTTLEHFGRFVGEGYRPAAGLVYATDGNFYGTTYLGGDFLRGTAFKMTLGGAVTFVHSFDLTGSNPVAGLVQGADGNFYGTTPFGGMLGKGTVFSMTADGALFTLYNFAGTDGATPHAALVQAIDGNFYGTTSEGGDYGKGTVFKITPDGTLTTLHSFAGTGNDGADPEAALVQASDGSFYGTTAGGGLYGQGTVFRLIPDLRVLWYNGDPNAIIGLANEVNTLVPKAYTYDDFIVPNGQQWMVTKALAFGIFAIPDDNKIVSADVEIRTDVSLGYAGTLVYGAYAQPYTQAKCNGFSCLQVDIPNLVLGPGHYWVVVAPVGSGDGLFFLPLSSGSRCVGTPCGSNGLSFFTSDFFGYYFAPASSIVGSNGPNNSARIDFSLAVYGSSQTVVDGKSQVK
jgi:uncharacterized repeat protein (TIGR03803 family)